MSRKVLRYILYLLVLMLLVTILSACSRDDIHTEHPSKTVLTLATLFVNPFLREAVNDFNISNDLYHIQIIDYSEFNTEDNHSAGYTKLLTEITAGKIPDILNLWPLLPAHQYVVRGLLEDLYPFIDSDPELNRSDLIENVMELSEIDGGFYRVFPGFSITTLIGSSSVLGEEMGWTIDDFNALLETNPQADIPLGTYFDQVGFLTQTVSVCIDQFVDLSEGACYFDTDEFVRLLEIANTLPAEIDYRYDAVELIADGRQIMMDTQFIDFRLIQVYKAMFRNEIVFKGYPTGNGIGNILDIDHALAMTTKCINKKGAWEFLRTFLSEEFQLAYATETYYFPSNQVVFDKMLEIEMTPIHSTDTNGNDYEVSQTFSFNDFSAETFSITQAESDQIIALINSVSFLRNSFSEMILDIIKENVSDYITGNSSAVETASVIQSRVSTLISEQK